VLVLAPEVFLPIRNVGAAFHASAAGVTASGDAFDLLAAAAAPSDDDVITATTIERRGDPLAADEDEGDGLRLRGVRVRRGERVVLDVLDLEAGPGEVIAITGESGSGKSSLLAALLGFAELDGRVELDGRTLARGDRSEIAWAGQAPVLLAATVAENVRLGDEGAPPTLLAQALRVAGVELDPAHRIGPEGSGLSGGQAQRVATARAVHRLFARDARMLLLDEPTSAQDPDREVQLGARLRELAADGRIVLVTTHRHGVANAADRVIELAAARV
jgi:ATP-binding cassette subfamily C protein CydD